MPALGGLVVGLGVYFLMPERRNQGVAEVIEACATRGGCMSLRTGVTAALLAATSIGAGASVGREGPAVHMGASLSAWIAERLRFTRNRSLTLLGCGAAAAVAASFNAPIAGVFFAMEVIVGQYALHVFAPVVLASVSATVVTRVLLGDSPAFVVPDYAIASLLEVPAFVLLGGLCGAVAIGFMHGVRVAHDVFARVPLLPWMRPCVGGFCIGLIALYFPHVLGVGYGATDLALNEAFPLQMLIALAIAKAIATTIALGSGFAGGVFSPSLVIGALLGGAFGIVAASIAPEYGTTHGAYTIMGMAGMAAAVLGAPISTILIMFELTTDYQLTIAVLIVATVASVVVQRLGPARSFFLWQLKRRGVDVSVSREQILLDSTTVESVMRDNYVSVAATTPVGELRSYFAVERPGAIVVVDDSGRLYGTITAADALNLALSASIANRTVGELIDTSAPILLTNYSLDTALALLARSESDVLVVVTGDEQRQPLGVVYRQDLVLAHNRVLRDAQEAPPAS